jgi:ribosomal protein S27AE
MQIAKSMVYGGELVDARDCDYDDFSRLRPLCPNCNEAVFLRAGSERLSSYGKKFLVPQHWCHFKSTSIEQKALCEARVSGYSETERQQIQRQAKGQRLKLIRRWFWKALTGEKVKDFDECLKTVSGGNNATWERAKEGLLSSYLAICTEGQGTQGVDRLHIRERIRRVFNLADHAKGSAAEIEEAQKPLLEIDKVLHEKICLEIFDFLGTKQQRDLLYSVLAVAGALGISDLKERHRTGDWRPNDSIAVATITRVVILVSMVPWATEFARLEAEEKTLKGKGAASRALQPASV